MNEPAIPLALRKAFIAIKPRCLVLIAMEQTDKFAMSVHIADDYKPGEACIHKTVRLAAARMRSTFKKCDKNR